MALGSRIPYATWCVEGQLRKLRPNGVPRNSQRIDLLRGCGNKRWGEGIYSELKWFTTGIPSGISTAQFLSPAVLPLPSVP
jgi:hypothetical protein